MNDSEESMAKKKWYNLRRKVIASLEYINSVENGNIRKNMARALSDCDDGKELSVIFNIYLIDADIFPRIYTRIHSSLKEELDKIGEYNIEPYESVSVANEFSMKKNHIILHIHCPTSRDTFGFIHNIRGALIHSEHFSRIKLTPPSLQCLHLETGRTLRLRKFDAYDLHINEFAYQLKQSDNRINELMLFLKIFFQNVHIYRECFMQKNCLFTLIIFYLQNCNPPVLASIKTIQETAPKNIIKVINFGLKSRCISMNPTQNIHQMIKGFFEFYSSLNFNEVIIAPYLGKVINKADFETKVFKYPEYEKQMQMLAALPGKPTQKLRTSGPVCVQDIFFLNKNLAGKMTHINMEYLIKCITVAHRVCCEPKVSIKNLYKSLLVNFIEELEQEYTLTDSFIFDIIPQEDELKSLAKFADQPLNVRKLWTKAYIVAIPQMITAVFKIDMTLIPPTENSKLKKNDETEGLPLPFKWSFSSAVDLWKDRNLFPKNAYFMQNELKSTEELYAARRDKAQFAIQFNGFITITITKNFSSLLIEMSSNQHKQSQECLLTFFGVFQNFMRNYNLEHRIYQLESQLQMR